MARRHLDRSEPSYEYVYELRSRVSGGERRPQLARLTERPGYTSAAMILPLNYMLVLFTPVMMIGYLHQMHVFLIVAVFTKDFNR